MKHFFFFILLLLAFQPSYAQFRVVDAETHEPVAGAYVMDAKGRVLEISDKDGRVNRHEGVLTISMLSYESAQVNGATQRGDVVLTYKPYGIPEVVVTPREYVKTSGIFRDVYRNDGALTIYREGIADFYYCIQTKKYTRRIRACRQYTSSILDKAFNFSIFLGPYSSFDLRHVHEVQQDGVSQASGDSTYYRVKGGEDNAMLQINDSTHGLYRTIIDAMKTGRGADGAPVFQWQSRFDDWTYSSPDRTMSSFVAYSGRYAFLYNNPMKRMRQIEVVMNFEFIVTDIQPLTKAEAKKEMKDKTQLQDFTLPNILPALGFDLEKETAPLKRTKFNEYRL